ncbi:MULTISPECIES: TSUP family transporter [unclassified Variovorax]|uniref:TSUP family transporter n=1 Tax=unclassified Variovorax TaxID=663243 RepID=UPI0008B5E2A9|nr:MULTISPECIES: TSUP family transporter [unclassified Variovorax]SEJ05295.1 Sulfite exporter TauE/SafE [Variovorax sp. OK202]SFB94133.1 hypothetical protein SAMN05444746_101479 [Variovorax sp. OK212]
MLSTLVLPGLGLFIGTVAVTIGGGATAGVPLLLLLGHSGAQSIATVKFALLGSFVTGALAHRAVGTGTRTGAAKPVRLPWVTWPLAVVGSVSGSLLVVGVADRVLKVAVALSMIVILWITHRTAPTSRSAREMRMPACRRRRWAWR